MYLAIITLPLLGSIVAGFFGRKVGVSGAQVITCTSVTVTTLLAIIAFFEVGLNNIPVSISLFRWIDSESLNVFWGFHFDSLTVSMLIPVLIVSSLVHIYSIGYMSHDPHNQRFFSYLSLFTFMMIILVTANNFLLMFVGWEGVGICSYLLVSRGDRRWACSTTHSTILAGRWCTAATTSPTRWSARWLRAGSSSSRDWVPPQKLHARAFGAVGVRGRFVDPPSQVGRLAVSIAQTEHRRLAVAGSVGAGTGHLCLPSLMAVGGRVSPLARFSGERSLFFLGDQLFVFLAVHQVGEFRLVRDFDLD